MVCGQDRVNPGLRGECAPPARPVIATDLGRAGERVMGEEGGADGGEGVGLGVVLEDDAGDARLAAVFPWCSSPCSSRFRHSVRGRALVEWRPNDMQALIDAVPYISVLSCPGCCCFAPLSFLLAPPRLTLLPVVPRLLLARSLPLLPPQAWLLGSLASPPPRRARST